MRIRTRSDPPLMVVLRGFALAATAISSLEFPAIPVEEVAPSTMRSRFNLSSTTSPVLMVTPEVSGVAMLATPPDLSFPMLRVTPEAPLLMELNTSFPVVTFTLGAPGVASLVADADLPFPASRITPKSSGLSVVGATTFPELIVAPEAPGVGLLMEMDPTLPVLTGVELDPPFPVLLEAPGVGLLVEPDPVLIEALGVALLEVDPDPPFPASTSTLTLSTVDADPPSTAAGGIKKGEALLNKIPAPEAELPL